MSLHLPASATTSLRPSATDDYDGDDDDGDGGEEDGPEVTTTSQLSGSFGSSQVTGSGPSAQGVNATAGGSEIGAYQPLQQQGSWALPADFGALAAAHDDPHHPAQQQAASSSTFAWQSLLAPPSARGASDDDGDNAPFESPWELGLNGVSDESARLLQKYFGEYLRSGRVSDLFVPRYTWAARPVRKLVRRADQSKTFATRSSNVGEGDGGVWGLYVRRRPTEELEEQVELEKWEDKIIWDGDEPAPDFGGDLLQPKNFMLIRNHALDSDDWVDSIVWDDDDPVVPPPFQVEDPTIINDLNP
ncbi:hypothetical protein HK405_015671, partial [Cladochytrium tenue]